MSNLVEGMLVGRVDFGESSQARSASYSAEDAMAVTIVRLYRETDELRAEVAMLQEQARILAEELAMALVKTIDELKTEKAELFVQLVNLQAGSRRATLDEIAESVRDKYDPEYEREEIEN